MGTRKPVMTDYRLWLHVYAGDDIDPKRYWIWFEGRERIVARNRGENPQQLWQRVLREVVDMRLAIRRGCWQGREYAFAHIYAGVQPNDADERERTREWCIARLWQEADPQLGGDDHDARVQALCTLADIFGLDAPRQRRVDATIVSTPHTAAAR